MPLNLNSTYGTYLTIGLKKQRHSDSKNMMDMVNIIYIWRIKTPLWLNWSR